MKKASVIVGIQWGDEGKGKAVDVFSSGFDIVVRFQGGANAGHTIFVNQKKYVFHLIPSGILHQKTVCVIAPGVVLDIEALVNEIQFLKKHHLLKNPRRLLISDLCTLLFPFHRDLDQAREESRGNQGKIGTTGKGIGPAYEDRVSRRALLFSDLFEKEKLKKKMDNVLVEKKFLLEKFYKQKLNPTEEIIKNTLQLAEVLKPHRISDSSSFLQKALEENKKVLLEGAQGALLDIFHGTYPYVTSSSTLSGSASVGAGIPPSSVNQVIGVLKAYTTRVGHGPFPSEIEESETEKKLLFEKGLEFGATTGRKRRCGWLDLLAIQYSSKINGVTELALMKLDVLSHLDEIKVCIGYKYKGKELLEFPLSLEILENVKPIYKVFPSWKKDISGIREFNDLPKEAKTYVEWISMKLKRPIKMISLGPSRKETLFCS